MTDAGAPGPLISLAERRALQRAAAGDAEAIEALWWDWRSPVWTCLGRCLAAPRAAAGLDAVRARLGPALAGAPVTAAPGALVGAVLLRWIVENSDLDDVSGVSAIQPPLQGPAAGLGGLPTRLRVGLLLPVLFRAPPEELARLAGQPWLGAAAERARRALPELLALDDPARLLIEPPPAAPPRRAPAPLPLRAGLAAVLAAAALGPLWGAAAATAPAPTPPADDLCWQGEAQLLSGRAEALEAALAAAGAPAVSQDLSVPPGWVLIGVVPPIGPRAPTALVAERAGVRATRVRQPRSGPAAPAASMRAGLGVEAGPRGLELRWAEGADALRVCAPAVTGETEPAAQVEAAARWWWRREGDLPREAAAAELDPAPGLGG